MVAQEEQNGIEMNGGNQDEKSQERIYGLDDNPPWYLCIFMALQHYSTMVGAIVSIPFLLTPALCMKDDDPARAHIICTMIFIASIVTYIQVTFGCRLPIVQGGTISFLVPTLAILNQPQWKCPPEEELTLMSMANRTELWQIRMRELSGAIAVSALFQVFIGFFGVIGIILPFITPLTIMPVVSLVGLTLFETAGNSASQHWLIASATIILLTVFSQCMSKVQVPMLAFRKSNGCKFTWFPLFKLFPVLLAIVIMWVSCGVLTLFDYFPTGSPARTDVKLQILSDAPWFRIPYPCQWGWPTVSVSGCIGMLAGVFACTVESLGYYPTIAKMSGGPPPPVHVINRGIGVEGLGTVIAGIWGTGNGTNTFGENVGSIGVTKIGSRKVIHYLCLLMLIQGIIGKLGAAFIIIPEPIIGGMFCVMFGMITAFGLSALQYVDLNSPRNLYIIGFSIFFPLALPKWLINHPGVINTGIKMIDNLLTVLLSTSILVGGVTGCLMDNLIPGTPEERGLISWSNQMNLSKNNEQTDDKKIDYSTYDFPFGMNFIKRHKWLSYIPCSPTYQMQ